VARHLGLRTPIVDHLALAPFRVLTQDEQVLRDIVTNVLEPLATARGGSEPLVDTLEAYFDEGLSPTAAARRLHLSVRAVSYRLDRIARLTGRSLRDPLDRFVLELAVRGCRLLAKPPFPISTTSAAEVVRLRT
jgi:DNA-binding PucR family transcriptional regulator